MKQLKQWMLMLLAGAVLLTACKEDDDFYYKGDQVANFAAVDQFFYFSPQDFTAEYDLLVGILKPAEEDLTIPVEVVKNTKPQYVEIEGATGPNFNVTIKKGETTGKIRVNVTTPNMVSGVVDTLQVRIVKPVISGGQTMQLVDETFLQIYPYCTFTTEQMKSLIGTKYTANKIQGVLADEILTGLYTVTVTNVVKDTIYLKNLFNIAPTANPNGVFRLFVDRSRIPYKLLIKEDDWMFDFKSSPAKYGDMYTYNHNGSWYGSIDFCSGKMTVRAYAFSRKINDYFGGGTSPFILDLKKQP